MHYNPCITMRDTLRNLNGEQNEIFIVYGEIKVLVYKQYFLQDLSLLHLDLYQKPLHNGKLYNDLFSIHTVGNDQCKGIALYNRDNKKIGNNILRQCCKTFTDTCLICIKKMRRRKPIFEH